eukprot:XP_001705226.1 Hypothetical protein GL50803_19434 [Giardia lamblia ATCC 50803]
MRLLMGKAQRGALLVKLAGLEIVFCKLIHVSRLLVIVHRRIHCSFLLRFFCQHLFGDLDVRLRLLCITHVLIKEWYSLLKAWKTRNPGSEGRSMFRLDGTSCEGSSSWAPSDF